MSQTENNLNQLRFAQRSARPVRFVYNTASSGESVARIGNVVEMTSTHVKLFDSFRHGVRTCIIDNIQGNVEVA